MPWTEKIFFVYFTLVFSVLWTVIKEFPGTGIEKRRGKTSPANPGIPVIIIQVPHLTARGDSSFLITKRMFSLIQPEPAHLFGELSDWHLWPVFAVGSRQALMWISSIQVHSLISYVPSTVFLTRSHVRVIKKPIDERSSCIGWLLRGPLILLGQDGS